jgi:uncharacterized protein (DUF2236 family)
VSARDVVSVVERPVSESSGPPAGRSLLDRFTRPADFEDGIPGIALLAGPANVIMQLSHPSVGYGVKESRVESGRIDRHPIKRARTTFTYLAAETPSSKRPTARRSPRRTRKWSPPTRVR